MPAKPFKPPRPIGSSSNGPARVTNTSTTNKSTRPSFLQDVSSSLLSESTPGDDVNQAGPSDRKNLSPPRQQASRMDLDVSEPDSDAYVDDGVAKHGTAKPPAPPSQQGPTPIPPKLLSRILHDSFKHPETKITKEAFSVLQKYMEMFMREAMFRAIAERTERAETDNQTGRSLSTLFLDVEDLERLTPQLLADFCFV